jgi:hypothetical protein
MWEPMNSPNDVVTKSDRSLHALCANTQGVAGG